MAGEVVKVMITRRFKEGKAMEIFTLLNKMRSDAMNQRGYVYGETLINHEDPQKIVVIAMWHSMENWLAWKENPYRTANEAQLERFLEEPTKYEVFVLGTYPPVPKTKSKKTS
jgi:heme-degrading monooxygenase HmoA